MWRGRRPVVRGRGCRRRSKTALHRVAHDQQRDVVVAALDPPEFAQDVGAHRFRREPHLDQRTPQPLEPGVDVAPAFLDQAVGVEARASPPSGISTAWRSYSDAPAPSGGPGRASANAGGASSGAISGGRCPASENVSSRCPRVVDRGEHRRHRQVQQRRWRGRSGARARGRAGRRRTRRRPAPRAAGPSARRPAGRGPSRRRSRAAAGRPRARARCRSRRRRRARRRPGGSGRRARCRPGRGSSLGSSERWSVSASRRSTSKIIALSSATAARAASSISTLRSSLHRRRGVEHDHAPELRARARSAAASA